MESGVINMDKEELHEKFEEMFNSRDKLGRPCRRSDETLRRILCKI